MLRGCSTRDQRCMYYIHLTYCLTVQITICILQIPNSYFVYQSSDTSHWIQLNHISRHRAYPLFAATDSARYVSLLENWRHWFGISAIIRCQQDVYLANVTLWKPLMHGSRLCPSGRHCRRRWGRNHGSRNSRRQFWHDIRRQRSVMLFCLPHLSVNRRLFSVQMLMPVFIWPTWRTLLKAHHFVQSGYNSSPRSLWRYYVNTLFSNIFLRLDTLHVLHYNAFIHFKQRYSNTFYMVQKKGPFPL